MSHMVNFKHASHCIEIKGVMHVLKPSEAPQFKEVTWAAA